MGSKIGATVTLIGILGGLAGASYVMEHGVPKISSLPALSSVVSLPLLSPGPKFKVEYRNYREQAQSWYGGGGPPTINVMRLKIQSLNEEPVFIKNVIVNDNADCSSNPLSKLSDALKMEGHDPGLLAQIPATSSLSKTMKYGDVATVPLFGCEPARVRVVTDRGEKVYDLE